MQHASCPEKKSAPMPMLRPSRAQNTERNRVSSSSSSSSIIHHPSSIIIIIIIIIIMYDWNQGSPSNRQPPGILSNKIEKLEPTISLEYPLTTALPHCHNICLNFLYFSTSTPPLPSPSIRRCAPTGGWKWMSCPAGIWRWFQPDFLLICSVVNRSLLACSTPQTVLFR